MKRVAFISIFLVVCPVLGQNQKSDLRAGARVDPTKPTVYLEYVCQDRKQVHLRVHNNPIWNITVETDDLYWATKKPIELLNGVKTYAAPNDKQISLQYRVEPFSINLRKVEMPKVTDPHVRFPSWIASQDSIQFLVPVSYLRDDLQVVIRFQYEWELVKPTYLNDPEHRLIFRGIDLPREDAGGCVTANRARSDR